VLRVVEMLRELGVVGKFVEFFGPGLAKLPLADRATISNMAPEYGATCGIFPVDDVSLHYLRFSGRSDEQVAFVEAYMKEVGLFHTSNSPEADYSDVLELDLGTVEPSLAGPKRPQDRILLSQMKPAFEEALPSLKSGGASKSKGLKVVSGEPAAEIPGESKELFGESFDLNDGDVVIAAITSCTNTSNPSVMVAAGLLAKKAVEAGLSVKPWVKTSLAPGSKVVTEYLEKAGLDDYLEELRFHTVGYGCTTCIGNSGPLPVPVSEAIAEKNLVATSVLSGNRNFEGRISGEVRANYLASPPLVVAYALAGTVTIDLLNEPLGEGKDGPVFLRDIWPSRDEIDETVGSALKSEMFEEQYSDVFEGSEEWRSLPVPEGKTFTWSDESTYVRLPPFFVDMPAEPAAVEDIAEARVLALLGDSVTTDHISPAGAIKADSPAGRYLTDHGVAPRDFNSYGSRRGNHEVMMRGTFANVRLRNQLVPGVEGGFTTLIPEGEQMSIYDASMKYQDRGTPLVVLAGKEYGTGSSRDWAAKGSRLLGIRAVIAESFERIHRSNLIGMGVAPLEFLAGQSAASLGLDGREIFEVRGLAAAFEGDFAPLPELDVIATKSDGTVVDFKATLRLDTPQEGEYYRHGGILQMVLRSLA
ncbi:MAG: aconitate hydratase, partial [Acidobacteriota bacterium]